MGLEGGPKKKEKLVTWKKDWKRALMFYGAVVGGAILDEKFPVIGKPSPPAVTGEHAPGQKDKGVTSVEKTSASQPQTIAERTSAPEQKKAPAPQTAEPPVGTSWETEVTVVPVPPQPKITIKNTPPREEDDWRRRAFENN